MIPPLAAVRSLASALLEGEAARAAGDWKAAADQFRDATQADGDDPATWLRLAEAEERLDHADAAEAALRRAIALDPGSPSPHRTLAELLDRSGRREEAASVRAAAETLAPAKATPDRAGAALAGAERWRLLTKVATALGDDDRAMRAALARTAYPIEAWDRFRRDIPIMPPPASPDFDAGEITVVIDASRAAPFLLRATLRSLQDQTLTAWRALVVAPTAFGDHPVAGFADGDPRIAFVDKAPITELARIISIDSGTALDPAALAWLAFAVARTGANAVFADHDHGIVEPGLGPVRDAPMLHGSFDRWQLAESEAPALVMTERGVAGAIADAGVAGEPLRRALLTAADATGIVAHVPRALATRLALPTAAQGGTPRPDDATPGRLGPAPFAVPARATPPQRDTRIAVVIPTRDAADMLARAVTSLRETARDPARLDIVVLDNRSTEDAIERLFADLERIGAARRLPYDAAFNYSLMCNVGAAASDAPVVLFANNDIEMLTQGWDDILLDALDDPAVGAVGARLLYPGGTVQHAGVAFGFGYGGVEHEGRDCPVRAAGPGRRYVTTHVAAAVTGAFLAVRRADFDAVGGFDAARLTIAYSDLDLCLKLRERRQIVLYCPAIEAIHYESVTRGRNETRQAVAWDEGERADFVARWGEEIWQDPGISPYWVRGGLVFDGLTEPPLGTILAHIDRSARAAPWRPAQ